MVSTTGKRDSFGTRAGFLMAAIGSAVGLGNMWRFSYQASEGGGAAFVLVYIGMTLILGIPLLLSEFGIGRLARKSPVGALREVAGPAWGRLGWIFAGCCLLIMSYYSVIAGWTLRYALESVFHGFPESAGEHFTLVSTGGGAIGFHLAFMTLTMLIVMGGIKGGIERVSMILMPVLFMIMIGLALWAATLDNGHAGYAVYLQPDLDELMNPSVWRAAAAQAFFSLGVGLGVMLTFASYLDRTSDLPESATIISFADFGVAFLSGLVVFPVIYSLGLQGAVGESTVGALFIALPGAFDAMGLAGRVVGLFFFIALAVGALTSMISVLEIVTATLIDELAWTRKKAAVVSAAIVAIAGIVPAMSLETLGLIDKIAGELLLVIGCLLMAVVAGWIARDRMQAELLEGASPFWKAQVPRIVLVIRFVVPPLVAIVLFFSLKETLQAIRDFFGPLT